MDWIGCRRAGVHAWLVTHFVLPVDGVLGYSWVSYFDLVWRHFRVFPVWKVSLFLFGFYASCLILSFWTREVLSAVRLCVPRSRLLRWQGRLLSGFHFDTTSPLRFVLPSTIFIYSFFLFFCRHALFILVERTRRAVNWADHAVSHVGGFRA